ncbi:MAG TPA: DUF5676 family membrane protein [Alphaproteobacteria bacterium]|nr:DUF5676 family membrane protein [Alphaproteobacteria bacterium]
MKLDAVKLGIATAIIFAIVWVICSLLVVFAPGPMMQMSGHMLHADLGGLNWTMHWTGFLVGLVAWSLIAGVIVWAVAAMYNRLT